MPVLNPNNDGPKPKDWRYAYDAFTRFRTAVNTVSRKLQRPISTAGWEIIIPGKFRGYADPRWQMTFVNITGQKDTVYIGSNGKTAEYTIKQIHNQYISTLVASTRPKQPSTTTVKPKSDPRHNPNTARQMKDKWDVLRGQTHDQRVTYLATHPDVMRFLKSKAGFLSISMRQYFEHPMSVVWPTPPVSQQEVNARMAILEQAADQKERAHRPVEEKVADTGPGWNQ